jgi:hypothetical protein
MGVYMGGVRPPGACRGWNKEIEVKAGVKNFYMIWGVLVLLWLIAAALLLMTTESRAEGQVYNIVQTTAKTWDCTLPTERTDGMALEVGELATVEYYTSQDPVVPSSAPVIVKTLSQTAPDCAQLIDFTALPLGQNYLWATVTDSQGNQSAKSAYSPFELTRVLAPPNAPLDGGFVDELTP